MLFEKYTVSQSLTYPRLVELNLKIIELIDNYKRDKWLDHLSWNQSSRGDKILSDVNDLYRPEKLYDRVAIHFGDNMVLESKRYDQAIVGRKIHGLSVTDLPPIVLFSNEVADAIKMRNHS